MSPKKKYTRDKIIKKAIQFVKKEGIEALTARQLAKELGSSVAPIYVNFEDIGELKRAVIEKIFEKIQESAKDEHTGEIFLDIGITSLNLADEYSKLFRDLIMGNHNYLSDYDQNIGENLIEEMGGAPELKKFNKEELENILLKMRIFQLGLSMMVANDLLPEKYKEKKDVVGLLAETGEDLITGMNYRKNK